MSTALQTMDVAGDLPALFELSKHLVRIGARTKTVGECKVWQGPLGHPRYPSISIRNRKTYVHRFIYSQLVEEIPSGHDVDHICHNPRCVNPDHLQAITHRENLLRGATSAARNAARTHCPRGHEYAGANLIRMPNGARACRTCVNARKRSKR